MKSVPKKACQSLNRSPFIKIVILPASFSDLAALSEAHFDNFVEPERGLSNHPRSDLSGCGKWLTGFKPRQTADLSADNLFYQPR